MKYAIVLPAGSGKTTLSKKYKNLIDIDSLLSEEEQIILKKLCIEAMDNNNWELHLNKEYEFIHKKIKSFDDSKILLCHHESKALKYDLTVIGSFKIPEDIMLKVAKMRSEKDKFRGQCTINNYKSCVNSKILESHNKIEEEIKIILKNLNN
tara:strand:- start:259 stop:714 length:456 start_codon:yes stop_codon:yes gene_type:complete